MITSDLIVDLIGMVLLTTIILMLVYKSSENGKTCNQCGCGLTLREEIDRQVICEYCLDENRTIFSGNNDI